MKLFIQIRDGMPHEHPIMEDNFLEAFPHIDPDNLPPEFAYFERVQAPELGPYEKNQRVQYEQQANNVYRDVWYCEQMTAEERLAKQNEIKSLWAANSGFASWVFDEETCSFKPPIPYPNDGKPYTWDEAATSWLKT